MNNFFCANKKKLKYVSFINTETLTEETPANFEIKYIDIGNVDSLGNINEVKDYTFENAPSRARRIVRHGDIIISTVRTYLQAIAIIENPSHNLVVSTGFAVIRPNTTFLDQRFGQYVLRSPRFLAEVEILSVGVSYPAINVFDLGNILISLPSIKKQKAIANFLDRETSQLDKLIAAKERLLLLLAEKRRALITQAVTRGLDATVEMRDSGVEWLGEIPAHWRVVRLKYIVILGTDRANSLIDQELPFIGLENIESGTGRLNYQKELLKKEEINQEIESVGIRNKFNSGDVLFSKLRPYLAKAFVAEKSGTSTTELLILKPKIDLDKHFLLYLLLASSFISLVDSSTFGSKMPRADWEFIGNIFIPIPSLVEQKAIVSHLEKNIIQLDALKTATECTISLLKERRASLIAAAVTGQIAIEETKEERNDCQTITVN